MESDKVNHILMMLSSKIPAGSIPSVRTRLENTDISESEILALHSQMKDPLLSILLSIFIGTLGVDRFYNGLLLKTVLAIKHATHVECHNQDIVTLLRP